MKSLIVEDDLMSRLMLQSFLQQYGETHVVVNGKEAIDAVNLSLDQNGSPYDLICMDILMPEMDGEETLKAIRKIESEKDIMLGDGARIIMTTALDDKKNIMSAFREAADGYLIKPLDLNLLQEKIRTLGLID